MVSSTVSAVVCGLVLMAGGAMGQQFDLSRVDLSKVPQKCLSAGFTMQSDCSKEMNAAQKHFGISMNQPVDTSRVNMATIQEYIKTAEKPTDRCCRAACKFNSEKCACDANVVSLASQATGNNQDVLLAAIKGFAGNCGYEAIVADTCSKTPTANCGTVTAAGR